MSTVKTKRVRAGYEPIKGYVLEKRIGRGGYGEVWRASAPGGLKKAVKFIYGQHDERRASQELKSLERIKGVQHPFILTLERFEKINNQLVIVTELADGSLEDVYKSHRKRGDAGIPRQALLAYMKDAADALDYLHELYKLQHLDIKPGNLLIVGGRVKVADFGLLKDLGDVECSMVGGLTPVYAPPEMFDGKPSMNSDQYSLAVMYQELLTSTRPFSGKTIAQLATQHVHNAPNLDPLPARDRPFLARALEKSPDRRFGSCSEFVDKLLSSTRNTVAEADDEIREQPVETSDVERLPKVTGVSSRSSRESGHTQTLIVALGGTGAECLQKVRSRVLDSGSASRMTLHSVLIDTDRAVTQTAMMIDATETVRRTRVIDVPLRPATEYRQLGTDRLQSISRRWIYNVPRNLQTGGMRPLGRLALVDHGPKVFESLRRAVDEFKLAIGEQESAKIYIVGSLTGGSGSGMYFDIAYLLRHLLDEHSMENESILSFLTTNRFQGDPSRPLSLHATKAALSELQHFLNPGNGYPGDPGAGWPSVPAARTPLHDAYVVAQSAERNAPHAIDAVVDYLWCDSTVGKQWLAEGRKQDPDASPAPDGIRSMSAVSIGDPKQRQANLLAPLLAKSLLLNWLGNPRESTGASQEFVDGVVQSCELNEASLKHQTESWFADGDRDAIEKLKERVNAIDSDASKESSGKRSQLAKMLTESIDTSRIDEFAEKVTKQVDLKIAARLRDERLDLSSALSGLGSLREHLRQLMRDLNRKSEEACLKPRPSSPETSHPSSGDAARGDQLRQTAGPTSDLGDRLVDAVAYRSAASAAATLDEKLDSLADNISHASATVSQAIQSLCGDDEQDDPWLGIDDSLREKNTEYIRQLHLKTISSHLIGQLKNARPMPSDDLSADLIKGAATLLDGTRSGGSVGAQTANVTKSGGADDSTEVTVSFADGDSASGSTSSLVSAHAPPAGQRAGDSTDLRHTQSWDSDPKVPIALNAKTALQVATPPLLECGGKQRYFLVCHDRDEYQQLEQQFQESGEVELSPILAKKAMPLLIHEACEIPLNKILNWLNALIGDDGKIADRLAARCDIDWVRR